MIFDSLDLVKEVAEYLYPVYFFLIHLAAQGGVLFHDDTSVKILDLIQENKKEPKRKRPGIHTTGVLAFVGEHKIALFFSGRQHAGENLRDLLQERKEGLPPPLQVGDIHFSILLTCEKSGVNPYDYLITVQKYQEEVALHPSSWLPWNYQEQLLLFKKAS